MAVHCTPGSRRSWRKKAYICLIGLPKLVATAPGRLFSIWVENWIRPIVTSGCGVTLPRNNASITKGTEGCGETVAVGDAAGVSVKMKLVAGTVGVSNGGV